MPILLYVNKVMRAGLRRRGWPVDGGRGVGTRLGSEPHPTLRDFLFEERYPQGRVKLEPLSPTERTWHECVELVGMFIGKLQRPFVKIDNKQTQKPRHASTQAVLAARTRSRTASRCLATDVHRRWIRCDKWSSNCACLASWARCSIIVVCCRARCFLYSDAVEFSCVICW